MENVFSNQMGNQIFKIEKKFSKRIIPKLFLKLDILNIKKKHLMCH